MRVFHVQLRPQGDLATPGFDRTADDTAQDYITHTPA